MFYTFTQNNSGGRFTLNMEEGITQDVIIEADSLSEALEKAEDLGLYFNGVDTGRDCSCCGDRWHSSPDENDFPKLYGRPAEFYLNNWSGLIGSFPAICVHYKDGTRKFFYAIREDEIK